MMATISDTIHAMAMVKANLVEFVYAEKAQRMPNGNYKAFVVAVMVGIRE